MTDTFKKRFFISTGITIGVIVILLVIILITRIDINKRILTIQEAKREFAFQAGALESLILLQEGSEKARILLPQLETLLPTRDELISFPDEIEGFAKAQNLTAKIAFGTETAASSKKPGSINFDMTVSGSLSKLVSFLQSLEKSDYFIEFSSFDITTARGIFNATVEGRVFSRS